MIEPFFIVDIEEAKNEEFMQNREDESAMGLTGTDEFSYLVKRISSPEIEMNESWEVELSSFLQKHPELRPSITI